MTVSYYDKLKPRNWIGCAQKPSKYDAVVYKYNFSLSKEISKIELSVTSYGVYTADINGTIVSYPLAPGYDSYAYRLQYQIYDITQYVRDENFLRITVGRGWCGMSDWDSVVGARSEKRLVAAVIHITYVDNSEETIITDGKWHTCSGKILYSDIFNGEKFDANLDDYNESLAVVEDISSDMLFYQEGEVIREFERIKPCLILTQKGEKVLDFGQEVTGYVEISLKDAVSGEKIILSHGEMLDKEGNFFNENYRLAEAKLEYTCKDGVQRYKPHLTFYGFRYVRIDEAPEYISADNFTAIVVHSDIKRTGFIESSNNILNKFFDNVIWSQRDNFLDVPTDCPQRNERKGWTGDAHVFCRTAVYNFDCEKFFAKWLKNVRAEQKAYGYVPALVPNDYQRDIFYAGWADAAAICPWEIYMAYGNKELLESHFDMMKEHVDYIGKITSKKYLWVSEKQFGDWLALDAPEGSHKGKSDEHLVASAFYAHSTSIVIKVGKILGKDVSLYEDLYRNIRREFIKTYHEPKTQTECVLMLHFNLTDDKEAVIARLVNLIKECGNHLMTGFIGTPYLLHALSENGETELAYDLLLREEFPSWLYPIHKGATTIWEHWDGIRPDGEFCQDAMNSFNHYAYGAVTDWIYGVAAGISPMEPGFGKIRIAPTPTDKLEWLDARIETRQGTVRSKWSHIDGKISYNIETPTDAIIVIDGKEIHVEKGMHCF